MIIEQLQIDVFGSLKNRCYTFTNGVNVIEGENESGKSTICLFIKFMFYGFGSRSGEREHGISFTDGAARGSMVCATGGKRYRIERAVVASGSSYKETLHTIDLDTGTPALAHIEPGTAFFGVDAEVFLNTAFIRQIGGSSVEGSKLKESVENILFSANEDINAKKAIRKLEEMRVFYLHKNKKGGRLYELEQEQNELTMRLKKATEANEALESVRKSVADAKSSRDANTKKIGQLQTILSATEEMRLLEQYGQVTAYQKQAQGEEEIARGLIHKLFHADVLPQHDFVTTLKLAAADLRHKQDAKEAADEALRDMTFRAKQENPKEDLMRKLDANGGLETVRGQAKGLGRKRTVLMICATLFLVLALCAGGLAIATGYVAGSLDAMLLICTAFLMAISVFFFIMHGATNKKLWDLIAVYRCDTIDEFDNFLEEYSISVARLDLHRDNLAAAKDKADAATNAATTSAVQGAALLDQLRDSETPPVDATQLKPEHLESIAEQLSFALEEVKKHQNQAEKYRAMYSSVLEQLQNYGSEAQVQERMNTLLAMLGGTRPEAVDTDKLHRELEFAQKANEALEQRLGLLYEKQASCMADAGDLDTLGQKQKDIHEVYLSVRKKFQAYRLALSALSNASEQLRSTVAPRICSGATEVIRTVTDGKYAAFGLDENYQLFYTDASGTRTADFLSAGTQELAFFGLRLSLIDVLFRQDLPPMIFDESFARMDDQRLKKILDCLSKMGSEGRQTLLFTCHKREAQMAETMKNCNIEAL